MGDTATPTFDITRPQIAAFVKDPRTVRDIEAFLRMVREQLPALLFAKVDESRRIDTDSTLTGGGDLSADRTLGIDITAETERIQDVIGAAVTDTATIDFTYSDVAGTITADVKAASIGPTQLQDTAVTPATYGDSTHVGQFTVDQDGRLTSATSVAIALPSGYTDEQAQDAVGAMVDASLTYVDATPLLQRAALTGDVTAAAGSNATTIANAAVTLAKIANAAANSKLLGSGASGSGASYAEITLGSNLSMSGTTLNVSVTGSGAPAGLGVVMMMAAGTFSQ